MGKIANVEHKRGLLVMEIQALLDGQHRMLDHAARVLERLNARIAVVVDCQ